MKRILSYLLLGASVLFGALSCVKEQPGVIDEFTLGRCLTPTDVTAKLTNGEFVELNWTKSKSTASFTAEFHLDEGFAGEPAKSFSITPDELPYLAHLEADVTYYLRVKALPSESGIKESNWYVHDKAIQTSAIKTSLDPKVSARGENSITLSWTADPEVDHIRIEPALDEGEYTRFDVSSEAAAAGTVEVTGLKSSTYYTLTLHFKSAERGSAVAWTRPSAEGAVEVADTASLRQALTDGAAVIMLTNLDTPYVLGNMVPTKDIKVFGKGSVDGTMPTLAGSFTINPGIKNIHLEGISFSGAASADPVMALQNHVITLSDNMTDKIESIKVINCSIDGYQRGVFYDNSKTSDYGDILFEGDVISNIPGNGGDFFDLRKSGNIGTIAFKNCTITAAARTLIRIDSNAGEFTSFEMSNCTLNDLVNDTESNNNGILHIRKATTTLIAKNNLCLNMVGADYCQFVSHNTAAVYPTEISNNHFFNCQRTVSTEGKDTKGFFYHKDANGAETGAEELTANGGSILSADPCVDSEAGKFNLTNAELLAAKVGDPRWFQSYVEVAEDLTLAVTSNTPSAKTWNFADSKTFYKAADKDMVRDGIRFYVKNNPVTFDNGLIFNAAGSLDTAKPESSDCVAAFKVNQPGSVVFSTAAVKNESALLIVALDGKITIGIPAGSENYMVTFADIVDGEEHMIQFYGTDAITVSALQWNNEVSTGGVKKLATPAPVLDKSSVNEGEDQTVNVSWEAVEKAGSYGVIFNGKTTFVADGSYKIATKTLTPGEYDVKVFAKVADDDKIRESSDTASVSFTVKEVLKVISDSTEWGAAYMAAGVAKFGDGTEIKENFVYGNLGFVAGGSKFKFGVDNKDTNPMSRLQLGGTGAVKTKACLEFIVAGSGKLTLNVRSSGETERGIKVVVPSVVDTMFLSPVKTADPKEFTLDVNAAQGDTVYVFSGNSGINIYSMKWVPAATKKEYKMSWDFSSAAWISALETNFTAPNSNQSDVDFTLDGLRVLAGGGSIKYYNSSSLYYIQTGGAGTTTKRCFEFDAPEAGTLKVWASNTGSDEALTRTVIISCQGSVPDPQAGGYSKTDGPHELTFAVGASGKVIFYSGVSGLCFYKAEYTYVK